MLSVVEKEKISIFLNQIKKNYGFLVVNYDADSDLITLDIAELSDNAFEKIFPNGKKALFHKLHTVQTNVLSFTATDDNIADFFATFFYNGEPIIFSGAFFYSFSQFIDVVLGNNIANLGN